MNPLFLKPDEQGSLEFLCWKSLPYKKRLLLGLTGIVVGFVVQILTYALVPGVLLIFLANLFLLPRGVTNVSKVGSFEPTADWVKVTEQKLEELTVFNRKIKKWDRTLMDTTNPLGGCLFFLLLSVTVVVCMIGFADENITQQILGVDIAVLWIPYWITGWRAGLRNSMCMNKVQLIRAILAAAQPQLTGNTVDYYFFMRGDKMPVDAKFKVNIPGQHPDFLGCYGQISLNRTVYLYFYTVLVAKKGFGLQDVYRQYANPKTITKEFKAQDDVEVLVIRQDTNSVTNGYITSQKQALAIFQAGLALAQKAAVKS